MSFSGSKKAETARKEGREKESVSFERRKEGEHGGPPSQLFSPRNRIGCSENHHQSLQYTPKEIRSPRRPLEEDGLSFGSATLLSPSLSISLCT